MLKRLKPLSGALSTGLLHCTLYCLSAGLSLNSLLSLLSGISEGLFTDALSSLNPKQLRKIIRGIRAEDLGRDLGELLHKAMLEALDYCLYSYKEQGIDKNELQEAEDCIDSLKKTLGTQLIPEDIGQDNEQVYKLLIQSDGDEDLASVLEVFLLPHLPAGKLRRHIAEQYPQYIQMCFAEGLQEVEHRGAWVAYQRLMFADFRELLQEINRRQLLLEARLEQGLQEKGRDCQAEVLSTNSELSLPLDEFPAITPSSEGGTLLSEADFAQALNHSLSLRLAELRTQNASVLELSGATYSLVREVRQMLDGKGRCQRISLIVLGLGLLVSLCFLAILIYRFYHQPFDYTVELEGWQGKGHHPLQSEGTLVLQIGSHVFKAEINADGQAVFHRLPCELEGLEGQVRLLGAKTMPYVCVDSQIRIEKSDYQVIRLSLEGIDRAEGFVWDSNSLEPVVAAQIYIRGETTLTDSLGRFCLTLPLKKQAQEQEFVISKPGYYTYRATHSMLGKHDFQFILEKK